MDSYAGLHGFTLAERGLLRQAEHVVAALPDNDPDGEPLRCHEVARVVAHFIRRPVIDGRYGALEHSWLGLQPDNGDEGYRDTVRRVSQHGKLLDTYAPGRVPQVMLVDASAITIPERISYEPGPQRTDIREELVGQLIRHVARVTEEQQARGRYDTPLRRPAQPIEAITATLRLLAQHTLGIERGRQLQYDPDSESELPGEVLPGCWTVGSYAIECFIPPGATERQFALYETVRYGGDRDSPPDYEAVPVLRGSEVDIFTAMHRIALENVLQNMHEGWLHFQLEDAAAGPAEPESETP